MRKKIEEILDILIEEIEEGKSMESCLDEYPEYADELRPLLLLTASIEEIPEPEVDPAAFNRAMAKINSIREEKSIKYYLYGFRNLAFRPVVLRTVSLVLIFSFILSMTFSFSADSLPGDFLYPVKCFCERTQLAMTFGNEKKAELHLKLADRKTEDFKLVFEKKEKINEKLLNSMINETSNALKHCRFLPSDKSYVLMSKTKECCQDQLKALHIIKPLVSDSDYSLVMEAMDECSLNFSCADSCLCSDRFQDEKRRLSY